MTETTTQDPQPQDSAGAELDAVDEQLAARLVEQARSQGIPGIVEAEMEPYRSPEGSVTTLRDSIFSTIPGTPAWVSKASRNRVSLPRYGMSWEYEGRNAIQADWRMEHLG
jgi:hypothetical protein